MSEEVFGKLSELHGQVRARIEATPDWKVLQAVERAMGDVKSILPVAVAAVVAAPAAEAPATAEAVPVEAAADAPDEAVTEVAAAEPVAGEAPAEAVVEAAAQEAVSATAETPLPAELVELVAGITTAAPEAAPAANGATAH